MKWRRYVVLCLGSIVGLLLYLAWRVLKGGATASILCGAAIASRLGCTDVTWRYDGQDGPMPRSLRKLVSTILLPQVARCTSAGEPSTSAPTEPCSNASVRYGPHGEVAGVERRTPYTSRPDYPLRRRASDTSPLR